MLKECQANGVGEECVRGEESVQQTSNDYTGLLNRFADGRDRKVAEPAGGEPTPAVSMLVVKSLLPLSWTLEEMIMIASCSRKQSFRNLKLNSSIGIFLITKVGKILSNNFW